VSKRADAIARLLADEDPESRRRAAQQLRSVLGADAAPLLLRALGDDDWRVRKEAAGVASSISPREEVVRALTSALDDHVNVGLRNAAVEALIGIGVDAVPSVVDSLSKLDADGRKLAIEVLSGVPDLRATRALIRSLVDADPNVRTTAAEALGAAAGAGDESREEAIESLCRTLSSPEVVLKLAALNSLTRLGARLGWELLAPLMKDSVLKRYAIAAAASIREPDAIAAFATLTGDSSPSVAREAVIALGECIASMRPDDSRIDLARAALIASRDAVIQRVRPMAKSSEDASSSGSNRADQDANAARVRGSALVVLALLRDRDDIPLLVDALADDTVAEYAEMATRLFGEEALGLMMAAGRTAPPAVRGASISMVPVFGSLELKVLDDLREALNATSIEIVVPALKAIGIVGAGGDLKLVAPFALHEDLKVSSAATLALLSIASRHANSARAILASIDATGPEAALGCVLLNAIAHAHAASPNVPIVPTDVAFLKRALSHRDARARRFAVDALATIGGDEAAGAVAFAIADEEREVVLAAVRALGRLNRAEPLIALLASPADPAIVAAVLYALNDADPDAGLTAAITLVRSVDPAIACAAVEAIGRYDDPRREERIFAALEHPDTEVVKVALSELARDLEPRALTRVGLALDHQSWEVRRLAAELLGEEGSHGARVLLRVRLEREKDPVVRQTITLALTARPTDYPEGSR
jgi:HEAT repeat protein